MSLSKNEEIYIYAVTMKTAYPHISEEYWFYTTESISQEELENRVKTFFIQIGELKKQIRKELLTLEKNPELFHNLSQDRFIEFEKRIYAAKPNTFEWLETQDLNVEKLKKLQDQLSKLEKNGMNEPELFLFKPDSFINMDIFVDTLQKEGWNKEEV
jgi:hypothetical protein